MATSTTTHSASSPMLHPAKSFGAPTTQRGPNPAAMQVKAPVVPKGAPCKTCPGASRRR